MSTHNDPPATASPDVAVTRRTMEIVVGILLSALGILAIVSNYKIGAGWAEDGPQAGYFPLRMGVIILIASIAVVIQALRKNDRTAFVEKEQLRLVGTVLVPLVVYVATIQFIGIYVASALFIGIFMVVVGKFSWLKSLAVGVGINLVLFWVFELMFKVPLPKGPLETMLGF